MKLRRGCANPAASPRAASAAAATTATSATRPVTGRRYEGPRRRPVDGEWFASHQLGPWLIHWFINVHDISWCSWYFERKLLYLVVKIVKPSEERWFLIDMNDFCSNMSTSFVREICQEHMDGQVQRGSMWSIYICSVFFLAGFWIHPNNIIGYLRLSPKPWTLFLSPGPRA